MPSREGQLVRVLVSMADTLVSDFDVLDLFRELVVSAKELLDAAEVGLLVTDGDGVLKVVAATSEATSVVELFELENRGGPGVEAFRTGEPVLTGPLEHPDVHERWSEFGEAARGAGFTGVTAVPMRLRDQVLGALNLFQVDRRELTDEDLVVAQALADLATIAILQDRSTLDDQALIRQLRTALETRVVIEQAKGVVSQEAGLTMDAAFARIRQYARDHNTRLREVAGAIISGDLSPSSLSSEG